MVGKDKEPGLSEVIGFLMIVALLAILFSMYLLYVVPIQGRDAEISHMKYITQEFIGLKADIDGLIINNKINMPIARSFELGTLSSVGSGALSILPLSSFIEATGTLMVNEQNDFLSVIVNGDMVDLSNIPPIVPPPVSNPVYEIECIDPDRCPLTPINFTINDRFYNITTKARYSFNDSLYDPATSTLRYNYSFILDLGPSVLYPNNSPVTLQFDPIILVNRTYDLVVQVFNNTTPNPGPYISEKTLIENLTFGRNYTYHILKDNDLIPNNTSDYFYINPSESIPADLYQDQTISTKAGMFPPRVGSFTYESANRYWVNQNLLYEMGGLFLNQPADGGSSVMLIPSIALTSLRNVSQDPDPDFNLKVSINNIRITDTEDISGSVSAQIFTKVDQIYQNIFNGSTNIASDYGTSPATASPLWKMREGEKPNARAVWLQFIPDDPRVINSSYRDTSRNLNADEKKKMKETTELWKRGFDQIKTIINKTIADDPENNYDYSRYVYNFRIENSTDSMEPESPPYSANMVIGEYARNEIESDCDPITYQVDAYDCRRAVETYLQDPCPGHPDCDKFILDYSESQVSLVMQSGAL
jgi:hypothetical protein